MSHDDTWIYDYITQYIKSATFRASIKDYIDENCSTFSGDTENSFQQSAFHNEFKLLIENLLEKMLLDIGASQESFLLAAKKGLESEENKKYFEQLIACENYLYFKNMMIKRNLQLEEEAFKLMYEKTKVATGAAAGAPEKANEDFKTDPKWKEMQKVRETTEMECAIQMSLALEEEKRKLMDIEEDDLRTAIELSKLANDEMEISLLDPTTLLSNNNNKNLSSSKSKLNENKSISGNNSSISNKTFTNSTIVTNTGNTTSNFSINPAGNTNIKTNTNFNNVNNISGGNNNFELKSSKTSDMTTNNNNSQAYSGNTWKSDLNKASNIDLAFYGNSSKENNLNDNNVNKNSKNNKDYVDMTIEKTEKLKFDKEEKSQINVGQKGNNANLIDFNVGKLNNIAINSNSNSINDKLLIPSTVNNQSTTGNLNIDKNLIGNSKVGDEGDKINNLDNNSINLKVDSIAIKNNLDKNIVKTTELIGGNKTGDNLNKNSSNSKTTSNSNKEKELQKIITGSKIKEESNASKSSNKDLISIRNNNAKVDFNTSNKELTNLIIDSSNSQNKQSLNSQLQNKNQQGGDSSNVSGGSINNISSSSKQPQTQTINVNSTSVNQIKIDSSTNVKNTSSNNLNNQRLNEVTINDNVNFNSQGLSFVNENKVEKPSSSLNKQISITQKNTDQIIIDDINDNSSKINLGQIKDKKSFTGDRNFVVKEKQDYSNIKSKIDNEIKVNKEILPVESANEELAKKYEQIQKDKHDKLKDYRDLIVKMKKDKRNVEKEKEENMIDENQLSDEVKKRLQMRKQLADKLKK